jgi:SAM-dependent methyltransferase
MRAAAGTAIADYHANAAMLAAHWGKLDPAAIHAPVLHLLPTKRSRILDLGAGSGTDAAWFAEQGHTVLAIEPADGLRLAGIAAYPSPRIEWLDDSLPDLAVLMARRETFDLVMLTAVWAHLDHAERARAIPNIAAQLKPGGRLIMSIRSGWTPPGRPTFEARPHETIAFAVAAGLSPILDITTESIQPLNRANDVTWHRLAFEKA